MYLATVSIQSGSISVRESVSRIRFADQRGFSRQSLRITACIFRCRALTVSERKSRRVSPWERRRPAGIFRRSLRSKALTVSERKSRQVSPWEHWNLAGIFPFFLTLTIS